VGDLRGAVVHYEQALARKNVTARTRAAVNVALGQAWLELGESALAATALGRARAANTPVGPWATWYEARAELARGRGAPAARLCDTYRQTWPTGPHADACLIVMGDGHARAGARGAAITAYKAYLEAHPESPMEETLRLRIALAVANDDPRAAIPSLHALRLDHQYHSTGLSAQRKLDEIAALGGTLAEAARLPQTTDVLQRSAAEMKRCGQDAEAWALFRELADRSADDPRLASWIESQEERFSWGTKQYDALAEQLARRYAERPDAGLAYDRYKALARGGRWKDAVDQYATGMDAHASSGRFRDRTLHARGLLLAGDYDAAEAAWEALARQGGDAGREARWLSAYAVFRAGRYPAALGRFEAIASSDEDRALAARWYASRTLEALGRADEARQARQRIAAEAPWTWYGVLAAQAEDAANGAPAAPSDVRAGRWPGDRSAGLPDLPRVRTGSIPLAVRADDAGVPERAIRWDALAWNVMGTPARPTATPDTGRVVQSVAGSSDRTDAIAAAAPAVGGAGGSAAPAFDAFAIPDAHRPGFLYDPATADTLLTGLGDTQSARFPWLAAAADLARAGAWSDAAPIVARAYATIDSEGADGITLELADWRQVFLWSRDDHHAAKSCWGATKLARTPEQRAEAQRCAYPTAQADALWRHGVAYDVDPLLAMGLMRQESVYQPWALSSAGAIGLMQVMPRTGARVAALMGDPHYSPDRLELPDVNVRYGTWYLSRLLDRFGGAFPLAVASYNGGPHNVSSWLRPWGASIRMDDYVEQIPYPETRDYVKKVTGYYATYVSLYGPPGARVRVPMQITADDASVIDF
jgi:soluble lytic murein transglycosylase-like protein/outer membrane protein assembly factor BamD (BamD/ComL family)